MAMWALLPVACITLFLLSLFLPRLLTAHAIAAWFGCLTLFLSLQLFLAYLVIAVFLR
jgi:hypothetical protein